MTRMALRDQTGPAPRRRDRAWASSPPSARARTRHLGRPDGRAAPASTASRASPPRACAPPSPAPSTTSRSSPFCAPLLSERFAMLAAEEAVGAVRARRRAISRARCSSPCRRSRWNGRSARRWRTPPGQDGRRHLRGPPRGPPATGRFRGLARPVHLRHGGRPGRRPLRHQGLADLALDRLLVRRDRDPARRRGDPPRRDRCGPLHRHRRLGESRIPRSGSRSSRRSRPRTSPGSRLEAVLEEPRRLRHGRGRRRPSCSRTPTPPGRGAPGSSATCSAAARRATASTAPARARTARPIIAAIRGRPRRCGPRAGRDRLRQRARHLARPRTTRWRRWAAWRCSASAWRGLPISSNKSMIGHTLTAAGAVEAVMSLLTIAHGRIPPTINYAVPDPAIPLDVVPNVARDAPVTHRAVELLRLRRPEHLPGLRRGAA